MSPGCTCGPHPCVNLTTAYLQYHKRRTDDKNFSSEEEELTSCHEQIRQACRSHGCFHVSIDLTNEDDDEGDNSPMKCMAIPIEEFENEIESLFSPTLLDTINADMNGGLVKVPIKKPPSPIMGSQFMEVATFRGRTAESGDEQQSNPEPKLSWEYCRCRSARIEECKNDIDRSPSLDSSHADVENNTTWNHLANWTDALHSIASVVIGSIGISKQVVLNEKGCFCLRKDISRQNNNTNLLQEKCNVDLLRCFRYDAISADDADDQLGSSSHTDWGSLTVVWQDDKGGLQTYCHTCEKWSDVAPAAPERKCSSSSSKKTIHLFVHVGDFLSLATHGEGMAHLPIWPSPRHRVICPTKQPDRSEESQCRRSLVYFAYPPPNISLAAAQRLVEPLINHDSCESTAVFQDYSLLHNQSQQQADQLLNEGSSSTNFETYEKMRTRPFGEVIQEKWNQVQRN